MLPKHFIEQIKAKNIVLFLGAGASYGAVHPDGLSMPNGQELSDFIAERFLGNSYKGKALSYVAELAISESSLFEVQHFIHELISPFGPSEYHLKISQFPWNRIFTTNYDFVLEEVYKKNKSSVQELFPVVRNTPEYQILHNEKTLPYFKLHGCLSVVNDLELPLILTIDQFINYQNGRERLFDRLLALAYDYPILFVGYSLSDPNIRSVLQRVDSLKGGKAMSYIVSPTITDEEKRYWESRRFTVFKMTFEELLNILDNEIGINERILGGIRIKNQHPLYERFLSRTSEIKITESLSSFINNDIDFVSNNIHAGNTDPKSFYKGYFQNWDPIIRNLDVRRGVLEGILFQVFLNDEEHESNESNFYLIHGNGGSGKSVLLKRLAFEAATEINRICLFLKPYSGFNIELLSELYSLLKERIYLFVDGVADNKKDLKKLLQKAKKLTIPITIFACEKTNIWNTECEELEPFLDDDFRLKYLTDKEINELLILLENHHSLNALQFKTHEERVYAFKEIATRELLVALYEATNSKSFEEIIHEEYTSIGNPIAQSVYLTVSIMHRLGAETRAGLISRVHGIGFNEFKEKLFKPLEYIVFDRKNPKINDYVYLTRHNQVAEIVFTTTLVTPQERFDEYVRIISNLNLDFESDRIAYVAMTNARQLMSIFPDPLMVRNFYDIATENFIDKTRLLQQRAIFEMNSPGGSLITAERLLKESNTDDDPLIEHSFAELILKKAESSRYDNEFYKHIEDVINRCNKLITKYKNNIHPYHTVLKAINLKLKNIINSGEDGAVQRTLKDAEKYFSMAKQLFHDDKFILETESTFNEIINNKPDAKDLLKKAFDKHKSSPFIALRYSHFLEREEDYKTAALAIKESLEINPQDKDLNYRYAELLGKYNLSKNDEIVHYLRRSFTIGDSRFQAQFWYARSLFLNDNKEESIKIFKLLKKVKVGPHIKNMPKGSIKEGSNMVLFRGEIVNIQYNFGFIRRDRFGDDIFFKINESQGFEFNFQKKVEFNIAFNFSGPVAINIKYIGE
ncbi:MAG: SIR2 family protein [Ferruginibacter sp.]